MSIGTYITYRCKWWCQLIDIKAMWFSSGDRVTLLIVFKMANIQLVLPSCWAIGILINHAQYVNKRAACEMNIAVYDNIREDRLYIATTRFSFTWLLWLTRGTWGPSVPARDSPGWWWYTTSKDHTHAYQLGRCRNCHMFQRQSSLWSTHQLQKKWFIYSNNYLHLM